MRNRVVVRRGLGTAVGLLLAATATGCYGPDQTIMWLHRDGDGTLTVVVPVCAGERVYSVLVGSAREGDESIVYRDDEGMSVTQGEVVFVIDDGAVASGSIAGIGMPQTRSWGQGAGVTLDQVDAFLVSTSVGNVGVDPRWLSVDVGSDWVVRGDVLAVHDVPGPVSAVEARAAIDAYCE